MARGHCRWMGCVALATILAARTAPALPYGINAHVPSAQLLAAVAGMGVEWVRIDMGWDAVEKSPGTYDWSAYDELVTAAEANGLRIYATLSSTPAWATGGPPSRGVPTDPQAWYDFCFRAAQRYRGRIEHFGLWNEPNLSRFWAGNRSQYVEIILKTGSRAVRDANPRAKVCGPELAHLESADWDGWLAYVLGRASDALDIVTHHIYPSGSSPGSVIDALNHDRQYSWEPRSVAEVLRNAGWSPRPFWLTETGCGSGSGNLVDEQNQAEFVTNLLSRLFGPTRSLSWVGKVFIYELNDDSNFPANTFGLLGPPPDYRPKLSSAAYAAFTSGNPVDDAEFVSAGLPAVLRPGEQVVVSLTVRNTGTTSWSETDTVRLGAVGDKDPFATTRQYLPAGETVAPGGTATFTFPFTAPANILPGGRSFVTRWQMVRDGSWWFGEMRQKSVADMTEDTIRKVMYLPGLANNAGLNGTRWRSDLAIFSAGPEAADLSVVALEQGMDNSSPRTARLTVAPGTHQRIGDVLSSLFNLNSSAALRLDVIRGNVAVAARSYTTCGDGTCGQAVPTLPPDSAVPFGAAASIRGLAYSVDRGAGSRTNVGLLNPTGQTSSIGVTMFAEGMVEVGTINLDLPPYGFRQITDAYRAVAAPDIHSGTASVQTLTPGTSLIAWATVVNNVSGEPTFIAPSSPTDEPLVVVTAAHSDGLAGSRWRSDLELFNPAPDPADLLVELFPSGSVTQPPAAPISLPGLEDAVLPDVISTLFGFAGSGALRITPRNGFAAAFSTTYNAASRGRLGQGVPAVRQSQAAVFGEDVTLLQLSGSSNPTAGLRTNIGFVNVSGLPITVEVVLYRSPSVNVGTLTCDLAPLEWRQLTDVFRLVSAAVDDGFAIVRSPTPGGRFLAYASVVDNASGDPFLLPGR